MSQHPDPVSFDAYATDYDAVLDEALSVSGETKAFFAAARVRWLAHRLARRGRTVGTVMDFGCGTGSSVPLLLETLGALSAVAIDSSAGLLEMARRIHRSKHVRFLAPADYTAASEIDVAYCNGVFHHIPDVERGPALAYIYRALRPEGLFSFWENNPWNPGTRYIMRRLPFDRDAHTLPFMAARRLLIRAGFQPLETHFLFVFPRVLRALRPLERLLSRVPVGGQYHILCRKPG